MLGTGQTSGLYLVQVGIALDQLWAQGVVVLCGVQALLQEQVALGQGTEPAPDGHKVLERLSRLQHIARQHLHACTGVSCDMHQVLTSQLDAS